MGNTETKKSHEINVSPNISYAFAYAIQNNCLQNVQYLMDNGEDSHLYEPLFIIYCYANGQSQMLKLFLEFEEKTYFSDYIPYM